MDRRTFLGVLGAGAGSLTWLGAASSAAVEPVDVSDIDEPLVVDGSDVSNLQASYLEMLKSAGVNCWTYNGLGRATSGLSFFSYVYEFAAQNKEHLAVARTAKEIRQAKRDGKIALVLGWQSADALVGDPNQWYTNPPETYLRAYYELGLRSCGFCYNIANSFGGGNLDPTVPLTKAGRFLVEEMHRLRILVDVGGHTGEQTSLDAVAISNGIPLICSHTNATALVDNPRNISDRLIEGIASTGGVIGITAVNDFNARRRQDAAIRVTPQKTFEAMLDHFDYIRKLVGTDHVALGPDFTEGQQGGKIIPETSFLFPPEMASEQGPIFYVKGFEKITELPNVISGLQQRGWSETDIHKVMGGNWLRVYEKVWGA